MKRILSWLNDPCGAVTLAVPIIVCPFCDGKGCSEDARIVLLPTGEREYHESKMCYVCFGKGKVEVHPIGNVDEASFHFLQNQRAAYKEACQKRQ